MINRISIKGRGDDVFFPDEESTNKQPSTEKSEVRASQQADLSASLSASEHASMQASKPASTQKGNSTAVSADAQKDYEHSRMRDLVHRDHPVHGSYRFTQDELDALRDIVYELEVKRGVSVTRNDVIRLGLNHVIEDYSRLGDLSLLLQVFKDQGRRSGR